MKSIPFLAFILIVCGCAALTDKGLSQGNLDGKWHMTLPAGFEYPATIVALGDGRYRLEELPTKFRGVYELRGDRLSIVEPVREHLTGFVWQVQDHDTLALTEAPSVGKTGSDYRGATLKRKN